MKNIFDTRGQVWVETVTYTLIALVLIGAVLAFIRPKLNEMQDKAIIEQTIEVLESINKDVEDVSGEGVGSKRIPEFTMKKGYIEIFTGPTPKEDSIVFTYEKSSSEFSEPGKLVRIGNVFINTIDKGKYNTIKIYLNYTYKVDFKAEDSSASGDVITIPRSSTTQKISFRNDGKNSLLPPNGACGAAPTYVCADDGLIYTRDYCNIPTLICQHEDIRPKILVKIG